MWPFKDKPETRASYTDAAIRSIIATASGQGVTDYRSLSASQIAATLTGRALASAEIGGGGVDRTGLTSSVLHDIGCALVLDGEAVFVITVNDAGVVGLARTSDHDIDGDFDPATWRYRLTLPGPNRSAQLNLPAEAVFHPRINQAPSQPHKGRSPIALAADSTRFATGLERQLADEANAPSGKVLPAPLDEIGQEVLNTIRQDLEKARGRTQIVPSMAGSWAAGRSAAPADWMPRRLGFDPTEVSTKFRTELHAEILSIAGVPPTLFTGKSNAEGKREALRQFLHTTLQPLGQVIEREARLKLGSEVKFDFTALNASDIQGRARAFQSLVAGGMGLAEAAAASGILISESED